MSVLRLTDVSHRFEATWVLLHVDLRVEAGQRILLLGDNGGGKTTLLRLCASAIEPTRGHVQLFDRPRGSAPGPARRRLALMTHQHFFYEALSASDNLRLVAQLSVPLRLPLVPELLVRVGLSRVASEAVHSFSAGMKRRLAIARILLLQPELVLLDEPFSQLDVAGMALMEEVLDGLEHTGVAFIMATHDAARGARLATHTLTLQQGSATLAATGGAVA